jgi:hypothetical protein
MPKVIPAQKIVDPFSYSLLMHLKPLNPKASYRKELDMAGIP